MQDIFELDSLHKGTYEIAKHLREEGLKDSELPKLMSSLELEDFKNKLLAKMTERLIGFPGHQLLCYRGALDYFNKFDISIKQHGYYRESMMPLDIPLYQDLQNNLNYGNIRRGFIVYGDLATYIPNDVHTEIFERQFDIMRAERDINETGDWEKLNDLYRLNYIPLDIRNKIETMEIMMEKRIATNNQLYAEIESYLNHCADIRNERQKVINMHLK